MARRSILVALAVAAVAGWSGSASAATAPSALQLASAPYTSPAVLQWTPGASDVLNPNVSQTVYRAPGACTNPLARGSRCRVYQDNTTSQHIAKPGDGRFCFSITRDRPAWRNGQQPWPHGDDRHDPADCHGRRLELAAGGIVKGTVDVSSTSADATSGVASSVLHLGAVGSCAAGSVLHAHWNTTRVADGTYDVCNVVKDRAGLTATATLTVTVANAVPAPAPAPAPVVPATPPPAPPVVAPAAPASVDKSAPRRPDEARSHPPAREERRRADPTHAALGEPGGVRPRPCGGRAEREAPAAQRQGRQRRVPRAAHLGDDHVAPGQERPRRAVRLRPQRQYLAPRPQDRVAGVADTAAPAHGQRRDRCAAPHVDAHGGDGVLQRAGLPQRQARPHGLAIAGGLPPARELARARHVHVVRVARPQGHGRGGVVRRT